MSKSFITDVLIVDDDADWRERMKELVGEEFSICEASTEQEAMSLIERQFFYCAVVDKSLIPNGGGDEGGMRILEALKNMGLGTKRLMLTSYGSIRSAVEALKSWDAADYIEKDILNRDGVSKVHNQIVEMISSSRDEYAKRFGSGVEQLIPTELRVSWETNVQLTFSEYSKKKVDYRLLKELLDLLVKELAPLTPYNPKTPMKIDTEKASVEGSYWSKGLGDSVVFMIGLKEGIDARVKSLPSDTILRQVNKSVLGGLVLKAGVKFEEFPAQSSR